MKSTTTIPVLDVWGPVSGWYISPATLRFVLASPLWESNSLCPSARSGSTHLLYYRGEDNILQNYEDFTAWKVPVFGVILARIFSHSDCVKSVRIRSYSGPYFPALGLNTERSEVSLRIQSKCGKCGSA